MIELVLGKPDCEYFCNNCHQLRLSLLSKTNNCGNCGSKDIIKGDIGSLNKDNLIKRRKTMKENTTQNDQATYKPFHEFFIAGVQHHQLHKVLKLLKEGNHLQLVPEPTNKFDPNAVRIECFTADGDIMCGYVPKKFSSSVCAAIEVGNILECIITELISTAKPWEQCKVEIREVKDV